jgi:hypothetical protein
MREKNPLSIRNSDEAWRNYYREYFRKNNEQRVKNIARCAYNNGRKRALKYNRPVSDDPIEIKMMKAIYLAVAKANDEAGTRKYSVDHIKELSTDEKSSHTYDNLAVLDCKENVRKSHRIRKEMFKSIRPQTQEKEIR